MREIPPADSHDEDDEDFLRPEHDARNYVNRLAVSQPSPGTEFAVRFTEIVDGRPIVIATISWRRR
jgi:hypothetical protein